MVNLFCVVTNSDYLSIYLSMSSKPMKPTKHLDTTLIPNTRRICQVKKYGLLSVWLKSACVGCETRYTDVFVARIDTMQTIGTHLCAASHAANPSDLFFYTGTVMSVNPTLRLGAPTATTAMSVCCGGTTTASFSASVWASVTFATS